MDYKWGSTGYGQCSMTGFCERDNTPSDYIKTEHFLIRRITNKVQGYCLLGCDTV
jgi:uncharacterized protein YutD